MGIWSRSTSLLGASARLLRTHSRLTVFPVLSGLSVLLVAAAFGTPAFFTGQHSRTAGTLLGVAGLLVMAMVATFFKAALITQADRALRGEQPGIGAGLAAAGRRWPRLLAWAVVSVTVSQLLSAIESRLGIIGNVVGWLADIGWRIVSFFVLPVIALEDVPLREAPRRSAQLVRRAWGEDAVGQTGIAVLGLLASVAGVAVLLVVGSLIRGSATLAVCLVLAFVWIVVVAVVCSALTSVYRTALYRYAADGAVPAPFADTELAGA